MRNPADTKGCAWKICNKATVTSGTKTKFAAIPRTSNRVRRSDAITCSNLTLSPIDNMMAARATPFRSLIRVAISIERPVGIGKLRAELGQCSNLVEVHLIGILDF